MSPPLLYMLILLAHLPGLGALLLWRKCWRFPILPAAFLGMFLFSALGSINVLSDHKIYRLAFDSQAVSEDFALILVYQVICFYAVAGTYIALRKPVIAPLVASRIDFVLCALIAGAILLIGGLYFLETGTFLILSNLDGSMNVDNALEFRNKYVYGLQHWPFYNIGFVFLPVVLSSYGLILAASHKRYRFIFPPAILLSFVASLSLGSKGGIINFVLSLGISYATYLGMTGQSVLGLVRNKKFLVFAMLSLVLVFFGFIRATPENLDTRALLERLFYRTLAAYPETISAAISYANHFGELREAVLPTIRGLLSHEQINLSFALHVYQSGAPGGASVPMAGEAFLIAGWPGVILILPVIYMVLIALQEMAFCLAEGLTSIAFSALYGYLAISLSLNGMFSSLFNLMYPGTLLLLGAAATGLCWGSQKLSAFLTSPRTVQHG